MLTQLALTLLFVTLQVLVLGLLVGGVPRLVFRARGPVERGLARLERALEVAQAPPESPNRGPFVPGPLRPPSSA